MVKQYHIGVGKGEVAKYVLLPGDPNRVRLIASFWDEAKEVANNREYVTYTESIKVFPSHVPVLESAAHQHQLLWKN